MDYLSQTKQVVVGVGVIASTLFSTTANAMGNNISVAAALEIHMLSNPAAAMKPNTNRRPLALPNTVTILSANRRWAPLRSMPAERMKPPNKSRMTLFVITCPTARGVNTPTQGKTNKGINAVMEIGIGSKIHQDAQSTVMATVHVTAVEEFPMTVHPATATANRGPNTSAQRFMWLAISSVLTRTHALIR